MKRSIRVHYIAVVVGLMAAMVFVNVLLNLGFFEKYYYANKQRDIRNMYETLESLLPEEGSLSRDQEQELRRLCDRDNLDMMLIRTDMGDRFLFFRGNEIEMGTMLLDYTYGQRMEEAEFLEKTDTYTVALAYNDKYSDNYMESIGTVKDGGVVVVMRVPVQNLRDNVRISNQFLIMTSFVALTLGAIVAAVVSRRLSVPVTKLSEISTRMAALDFTARYEGKEENELGELGRSMNHLSSTLEQTITDLKSANLTLQKDIEKKEARENMRQEFLAGVSHELKTPIALIRGYAEGLNEGINDDAESREFYCNVIMEEAEKLDYMVHRMLTLNEIEMGDEPNEMEHFNIRELMEGILQSFTLPFEQGGVTTELEAGDPIYVWADPGRIEEVFRNYVNNALHHLEGEKKIRVWTERKGELVRVLVFNTGKPIPEEEQEKIWLRFYKVDKARTRAYGGNGIGLSIVKAVMDAHGRACGTYNTEDGVVFWFELDAGRA